MIPIADTPDASRYSAINRAGIHSEPQRGTPPFATVVGDGGSGAVWLPKLSQAPLAAAPSLLRPGGWVSAFAAAPPRAAVVPLRLPGGTPPSRLPPPATTTVCPSPASSASAESP